ncbi:MAG: hypothetical protein EBZ48_02105 [Proteobacteria bacterium]|nr:hypothetical protein [Pseudomonadota bacterium]
MMNQSPSSLQSKSTNPTGAGLAATGPKIPDDLFNPTVLAADRGFFRSLYDKCSEFVKSSLYAGRALDNIEKLSLSQERNAKPSQVWSELIGAADNDAKVHLVSSSAIVSKVLATAANGLLQAIEKYEQGFQRIAGCGLGNFSPKRRASLTREQRAKVVDLDKSLRGDFQQAESKYNEVGRAFGGMHAAVASLIKQDKELIAQVTRDDNGLCKQYQQDNIVALNEELPGVAAKIPQMFDAARPEVFRRFSSALDPKDENGNPRTLGADDVVKAAATASKELQDTEKQIAQFVAGSKAVVKVLQESKKFGKMLKDSALPEDIANNRVVTVSQETFDKVKDWYELKMFQNNIALLEVYEKVTTTDQIEKFQEAVAKADNVAGQQRQILQGIARAIKPLQDLTNPKLEGATSEFTETVCNLKKQVEDAALRLIGRSDFNQVMTKLSELQKLSESKATSARAELKSEDKLTSEEAAGLVSDMQAELAQLLRGRKW